MATDAEHVAASVADTCALAERVSGRVRELDRAAARVADTLLRIDAIVDRAACLEAARSSLEASDYERSAEAVSRYAQLDAKYPAVGEADGQAAEQHAALEGVRASLEAVVRARFGEAVGARRHADVLRFAALFPKLGAGGEGAAALVAYLVTAVAGRARAQAEALSDSLAHVAGGGGASAPRGPQLEPPTFGGALQSLFGDVAEALEEHEALLVGAFGRGALAQAAAALHAEVDARGSQLLRRFAEHHGLARLAAACGRRLGGAGAASGGAPADAPDPRAVELLIEECLQLISRCEEYGSFLEEVLARGEAPPGAAAAHRSGAFARACGELEGHYVALEEYWMGENVGLAVRIAELPPGSLTTSLVDDAFYILLKCGRRAATTRSVQCACAVLNHVAARLAGEVRQQLAAKARGAPQRLVAAAAAAASAAAGGTAPPGGAAAAREAAACVNDVDVSAEYALKLRAQLEAAADEFFPSPSERDRIRSVLAELGDTGAALRRAASAAANDLAAALAPRLRALVDGAAVAKYELTEAEFAAAEGEPSWALRLLGGCEAALQPLQPLLCAGSFDALVQSLVDGVATRLEAVLWQRRFNALGALALDRDLRTLVSGLAGLTPRTVRDKFARLTQMATVVGLEAPEELLDFWGDNAGALTWRLSPAEVRRALALRLEFRSDHIAALRL